MKFPHYLQLDAMDCGPTCLRIIAKFYGKSYSLRSLRAKCHITRAGVSMLGISDAAESLGFRTKGVKITWEQLRDEVPLPCIVHWNQQHFVVVYDIKRKKWDNSNELIYVSDPAQSNLVYRKKEFLKCWYSTESEDKATKQGTALLFEPTPKFYNNEEEKEPGFRLKYLLGYLQPYRRFIFQLFLAMLTGSVISLIFPFITQSVVDFGINNSNLNFIIAALIAQVVLTFGQTANSLIQNWLSLHITTRISIAFISDFLSKMEIPGSVFEIDGYGSLPYPKNLFVTGTVNIDETTYMFSPKVLDRANVIEFKPEKDSVLTSLTAETEEDSSAAEPGMAEGFLQLRY